MRVQTDQNSRADLLRTKRPLLIFSDYASNSSLSMGAFDVLELDFPAALLVSQQTFCIWNCTVDKPIYENPYHKQNVTQRRSACCSVILRYLQAIELLSNWPCYCSAHFHTVHRIEEQTSTNLFKRCTQADILCLIWQSGYNTLLSKISINWLPGPQQ